MDTITLVFHHNPQPPIKYDNTDIAVLCGNLRINAIVTNILSLSTGVLNSRD